MSEKTATRKVLVVTSRNVHYRIVAPVVHELQRSHWDVRVLRFEGIWERVESFLSRTTRRRSLKSFYMRPTTSRPNKIKERAYSLISKFVFYALRVLQVEKPDIIIVMSDSTPPSRIAVLAGRLSGIPSLLLLLSGMIGRNYECPRFVVDKIAVPGEFARDVLEKCGVDKEKLVITGYPSYDVLVKVEEHFNKSEICKKLGLDSARKTIVYATENLPASESVLVTRAVCQAVKAFSGVQFVIKVHPSELDLSVYRNVTKELRVDALITRQAPIYEVLYVCDLVITGFSATALDAMILDRPVVTINLTGLAGPIPFAESGAAIGVYQEKDLVDALKKGLYDEASKGSLERAKKQFVYEHAYKLDGKATARVVTLIQQMARH